MVFDTYDIMFFFIIKYWRSAKFEKDLSLNVYHMFITDGGKNLKLYNPDINKV